MRNISFGNSFDSQDKSVRRLKSKFDKLMERYLDDRQKLEKSDLKNSPVMIKKELEYLERMEKAAQEEGLIAVLDKIAERKEELLKKLPKKEEAPKGVDASKTLAVQPQKNLSPERVFKKFIKYCEDKDCKISLWEANILTMYSHKVQDSSIISMSSIIQSLPSLLKACKNTDGHTSAAIGNFAIDCIDIETHPNTITQLIENFAKKHADTGSKYIDDDIFPMFKSLKEKEIEDNDAIKIIKFIKESDFEDNDFIKDSIVNMNKEEITVEAATKIISALAVKNIETSKLKVSPDAVNTINKAKRVLTKTRKNGLIEEKSPIGQLSRQIFHTNEGIVIVQDGQYTIVEQENDKTRKEYLEEYNKGLSDEEDEILAKFAHEYKDKQGNINPLFVRVLSSLRNNGITNESLLDTCKFVINDDSVDMNNLNTINALKKSGMLSRDILQVLDCIPRDDNGVYNEEDIQNACDLTSAVISGKDIIHLLPIVRGAKALTSLIADLSSRYNNKSLLVDIAALLNNEDSPVSEPAIELTSKLAENFLPADHSNEAEEKFINILDGVMEAIKTPDSNIVNENGVDICSIMCDKKYPLEDIMSAVDLCKDVHGDINSTLADIFWSMLHNDVPLEKIHSIIHSCKDDNNNVKVNLAETIYNYWKSGVTAEDIGRMLVGLSQEE